MRTWIPLSDAPITRPDQDECGLARFAKKIAPALVAGQSEHSVVVGLYAPWGQGKTSLLNLIEAELGSLDGSARPVIVRFNPWLYGNAETLLLAFFGSLSEALGTTPVLSQATRKVLAKAIRSVGAAIGPLVTAHPGVGTVAAKVGPSVAADLLEDGEASFEKKRRKAAQKLLALGRNDIRLRLVVLIDDLDRADVDEVFAMLKLVRLIADLPNATYVLAMDHARVSGIVAERMKADVALSYLEKIVQVTINVPPLEPALLKDLTKSAITRTIDSAGVATSGLWGNEDRWNRWYEKVFGVKVRSLRDRARFVNAVGFALSTDDVLDVDASDIVGVCFLQTFFPATYERVRQSKGFLTAQYYGEDLSERIATDKSPFKARRTREFLRIALGGNHPEVVPGDETTYGAIEADNAGALRMLIRLFPFALNPSGLTDSALADARRVNRIAVADRFDRYFQLVAPVDDVGDFEVDQLLLSFATLGEGDPNTRRAGVHAVLRPFCTDAGTARPGLIQKVADRIPEISPERSVGTARSLLSAIPLIDEGDVADAVRALAANADVQPDDGSPMSRPNGRKIVLSLIESLPSPFLALDIGEAYARNGLERWNPPADGDPDFANAAVARMRDAVSSGADVFGLIGGSSGAEAVWNWVRVLRILKLPLDEVVAYLRALTDGNNERIASILGMTAAWGPDPSLSSEYIKPIGALTSLEEVVGLEWLDERIARLPADAPANVDPHGLIAQYLTISKQFERTGLAGTAATRKRKPRRSP